MHMITIHPKKSPRTIKMKLQCLNIKNENFDSFWMYSVHFILAFMNSAK